MEEALSARRGEEYIKCELKVLEKETVLETGVFKSLLKTEFGTVACCTVDVDGHEKLDSVNQKLNEKCLRLIKSQTHGCILDH